MAFEHEINLPLENPELLGTLQRPYFKIYIYLYSRNEKEIHGWQGRQKKEKGRKQEKREEEREKKEKEKEGERKEEHVFASIELVNAVNALGFWCK